MKLYSYQEKVLEAIASDPSHSQLISMPTGTGKTITFLSAIKKQNKRCLVIVHREELLTQTYDKAKLCGFDESEISLVSANKKDDLKKLNICMVQTLARNLEKYLPEEIEMMVIDEAHHATAESYAKVIKHFRVFEEKKLLLGFTATPLRGDKDCLSGIFLSHSFKMTLSEATREGYIVPVHGIRIEIDKKLADIEMKQGDYDIQQLDRVMNCESINNLISERCKNLMKSPSIIFTTSVNHAQEIARKLREHKRKAISISYMTPKKTLERIFNMLKQGRIEFITNAVKLSEGFDHPAIKAVIIARPTRSPVLYKQMIGRGLRNYPDKYDCFVLEFTSNDPKMMRWEDIDESATFQATSLEKRKTHEQAKNDYKQIFRKSDVEILDVRVSPFEYYECKLRRLYKYREYYFIPFQEGFVLFEIKPKVDKHKAMNGSFFDLFGTMVLWRKLYEEFYVWDEYRYPMRPDLLLTLKEQVMVMNYYAKENKFGKWYPSELEPMTRKQYLIMKAHGIGWRSKPSARKSEMEIEEFVIRKCIDRFLSKGIITGTMNLLQNNPC